MIKAIKKFEENKDKNKCNYSKIEEKNLKTTTKKF